MADSSNTNNDPFIIAQSDATRRVNRLLERAQNNPQTPLGDQTVVAELLAVREDQLIESRTRYSETSVIPQLQTDVAWAVNQIKRQNRITIAVVTFLATVVGPVISAVLISTLS